jgi:protein O-GlcNAc transferase
VFVALARELKECQFVFFTHSIPNLSDRLQLRLKQRFDEAGLDFGRYCRFIPWQRRSAFYGLMERANVMLDTIGFSGFNTAMQAMECGLPVVTREGRFMRGNLASGILKRIRLPELVAVSDEDYIAITLRLVRDAAYGQYVRDRIEQGRPVLFDDLAPIRALEDFLLAAARH